MKFELNVHNRMHNFFSAIKFEEIVRKYFEKQNSIDV